MKFILEVDLDAGVMADDTLKELGRILRYWAGNLKYYDLPSGTASEVDLGLDLRSRGHVARRNDPRTAPPARSSDDASPRAWSSGSMPGGTSFASTVTSVASRRESSVHFMIIVPANAGSSEANVTAQTMRFGGSSATMPRRR